MTSENTPPPSSSFSERLGIAIVAFLRALVRLLVIVILGTALGVGIFYGIPALYRRYVLPVQTSIVHLQDAQSLQDQTNQQLTQRLNDLQSRLDSLEVQSDADKQSLAEVQTRLGQAESTQLASQEGYASAQATASARIDDVNAALDKLDKKLADLEAQSRQANQNLQAVSTQVQAEDAPVAVLRREVQVVKAMELLTRSRLFLIGNNPGLAQQDVQAARDLLATLRTQVPAYQVDALDAILQRLDLALGNLPGSPVLAADDLEIAWQLLQRGLPGEPTLAPISTGTASLTPEGTPNPATDETTTEAPAQEPQPGVTTTPTSTPQTTPTPSLTAVAPTATP